MVVLGDFSYQNEHNRTGVLLEENKDRSRKGLLSDLDWVDRGQKNVDE